MTCCMYVKALSTMFLSLNTIHQRRTKFVVSFIGLIHVKPWLPLLLLVS